MLISLPLTEPLARLSPRTTAVRRDVIKVLIEVKIDHFSLWHWVNTNSLRDVSLLNRSFWSQLIFHFSRYNCFLAPTFGRPEALSAENPRGTSTTLYFITETWDKMSVRKDKSLLKGSWLYTKQLPDLLLGLGPPLNELSVGLRGSQSLKVLSERCLWDRELLVTSLSAPCW